MKIDDGFVDPGNKILDSRLLQLENVLTYVTDNFNHYLYTEAGRGVWLKLINSEGNEIQHFFPSLIEFNQLVDSLGQGSRALFVGWRWVNLWHWPEINDDDLLDKFLQREKKDKKIIKNLIDIKEQFKPDNHDVSTTYNALSGDIIDWWITFLCESLIYIKTDSERNKKLVLCKHPGCNNVFLITGRGHNRIFCDLHKKGRKK